MTSSAAGAIPRFYPILDTARLAASGIPLPDAVRAACRAGVALLQVRHKGLVTRAFFTLLMEAAACCREHAVHLIVNDRPDLAALAGAGCHVGQDDLPPTEVRRLVARPHWVGYSTHNEAQLREGARWDVDYLALGPIFATSTKENPDPVVGLAALSSLRPLSPVPLVAIGGITRQNARAVLDAGADAVALIADLFAEPANVASFEERLGEWLNLLGA